MEVTESTGAQDLRRRVRSCPQKSAMSVKIWAKSSSVQFVMVMGDANVECVLLLRLAIIRRIEADANVLPPRFTGQALDYLRRRPPQPIEGG